MLDREQVNLAEWAVEWLKKGMIEQIVDPHLRGQIRPSSLKIFGETAEKCLAEYGVDRPAMGDVLWNLENALRIQVNERPQELHEETIVGTDDLTKSRAILGAPSSSPRVGGDDGDGTSDITTSRVFSQLINRDGR
ncbi:putative receptor-like protein kinase [Abeliophyllum distichum]|uniref:Receptor-like protein kinase n=1 Tax=Abeliophyllum distichum TaxID=126358 RepID=A0ABD1VXG0_9LAMI